MSQDILKALTVTQPWASLVQRRAKRIETRSWYTHYRGHLVIHAAKNYPIWAKELAATDAFRQGLGCNLGTETLSLGVGLCQNNVSR